jgi:hypothetical protein
VPVTYRAVTAAKNLKASGPLHVRVTPAGAPAEPANQPGAGAPGAGGTLNAARPPVAERP